MSPLGIHGTGNCDILRRLGLESALGSNLAPPFTERYGSGHLHLSAVEFLIHKESWCPSTLPSNAFLFFSHSFVFLRPHEWHMEVPRLGVQSELLLLVYARAIAMPDLSCICDLHHSSWQHGIPNPMSKARDQTCNLMAPSRIGFHCTVMGIPRCISDFPCSASCWKVSRCR